MSKCTSRFPNSLSSSSSAPADRARVRSRKHFLPTEVLSSDYCRGLVSDDENDQAATGDAFSVLHYIAAKRLALGKLTVVDATNVQPESRKPLVELARQYHCLPVAIVLNPPERLCQDRNRDRADRNFGPHVIVQQRSQLRRSLRGLGREGFRHMFVLESPDEIESAVIERVPLWNDRRDDQGPFDIIGDIHGCCDELEELLNDLGYQPVASQYGCPTRVPNYSHPSGRKAVFVGDLVDRGPRVLDSLALVRNMVEAGTALCVPGNHDMKLLRKLRGSQVQVTHGLAQTLGEIDALRVSDDERKSFCEGVGQVPRWPGQPLCVRRRAARRRPCRHETRDAGPWVGQRARFRTVWRDDR